ncbi:transcriptional regulator [Bradyrhizobium sp. U87765 SZCCT0131]|uniref:transcriptional regulator n=1 Tax=unclassified Bradyrhizobium TaxID=2631580 RepID=UPI001BA852DC|nr:MULTISPECIES: transcriptional regulator [unclassified Bradyrhizobium]MBR1221623.1 transcriptional regulator [Bradyrhizobium sp. U87765 SZCCT0131]MBR1264454.1 transcriptional regulator [Bradyrhizobium sp. U87765 SZCCT0134]MBR1304639.1 transcriptional regulator [Bradyrhizobium sp. U87765 SZCCT0110]MBR1322504.1 transcriptional regulator [Bradyrhizobium sp. U87765 SZCCT0109]MBR1346568.1 transcriptional regulator [Bradyrhizobium sp. U87765 SZCCT0048]
MTYDPQALRERRAKAAAEGVVAMAERRARDAFVRENMARLRALRLAREAHDEEQQELREERQTGRPPTKARRS